jgi:hypothetical protein
MHEAPGESKGAIIRTPDHRVGVSISSTQNGRVAADLFP